MKLKRGDLVTRKSYNHDTVFKITNIKNDMYYLKGVEVRLYADSPESDLVKYLETTLFLPRKKKWDAFSMCRKDSQRALEIFLGQIIKS